MDISDRQTSADRLIGGIARQGHYRMIDRPELDPEIAAEAPSDPDLTPYDRTHMVTYLRLLDADAENAPWDEVARIVLGFDPVEEPQAARLAYKTHLKRAQWMTEAGHKLLLQNAKRG